MSIETLEQTAAKLACPGADAVLAAARALAAPPTTCARGGADLVPLVEAAALDLVAAAAAALRSDTPPADAVRLYSIVLRLRIEAERRAAGAPCPVAAAARAVEGNVQTSVGDGVRTALMLAVAAYHTAPQPGRPGPLERLRRRALARILKAKRTRRRAASQTKHGASAK